VPQRIFEEFYSALQLASDAGDRGRCRSCAGDGLSGHGLPPAMAHTSFTISMHVVLYRNGDPSSDSAIQEARDSPIVW
jgi:hypothetical protein